MSPRRWRAQPRSSISRSRNFAELARGLHPAALTEQGLGPALSNLANRLPIEVDLSAPDQRLPENIEATTYYIVSEALTNVVKHAQATKAKVDMTLAGDVLKFEVTDDGRGGADPSQARASSACATARKRWAAPCS